MPGWKLPVAVGWRSPILRLALTPCTPRICGDCSTLVRASPSTAWRSAPGMVVDQSALERWPRFEKGMPVLVVVVVVAGVVPLVEVLAAVELLVVVASVT